MATKGYTKLAAPDGSEMPAGVEIYEWTDLDSGDDGTPIVVPHRSDKTVQVVVGTAGDSSILIEGTTDTDASPDAWATLNDPSSTALDLTASAIKGVLENVYKIRPRVDGTTGANHVVRIQVTTTARR